MELELRREVVNCFELALDATVCQEETQEAIVPDACPDILRILDTRAQALLTGKQVREGAVTVTGLVRASVFYLPEEGGGVRHVELTMPFTCQAEAPGLSAQAEAAAVPRVRWAETRALNPRKVLLRADLAVDMRAYQPTRLDLCCGVEQGEDHGIHQLISEQDTDLTVAVQEKPFTFSESIDLGFSGADQGRVLCIQAEPFCAESKLIGSKLIFKGTVELEALCSDAGTLKTVRHSLPFSQIMEAAGSVEQSVCEVRVVLSDLTFIGPEDGSGTGEITLELLAQAEVRENRRLMLLSDVYSTGWLMDAQPRTFLFRQTLEQGVRAVPVRELLETTTMVHTVCHCWADLGEVSAAAGAEQTDLTAEVTFTALYLDDAEQLQSIRKTISVPCRAAAGSGCQCWCSAPRELFVTPAAGGLEVRFSLDFHCLVCAQRQVTAVDQAALGEERPRADGNQPSIILRLAAPGERLWDIAKSYGTTAEEITKANELEEGVLPDGRMLLIPRVR